MPGTPSRDRLTAVDELRGLVMVLMALDHARDYFGDFTADPTDLATTTPALFLTRWVTHFCAPTFVLLAGTGAWLYGARGRSRGELAVFLATRGVWLIALELTVVYFAWTNSFALGLYFFQVIGAIGAGMVAMAALVWLPRAAIAAIGAALIGGLGALASVRAADLGAGGWLWTLLVAGSAGPGLQPIAWSADGPRLTVLYPVLPWLGVMALGYALGPWCAGPRPARRRRFAAAGALACAAFVGLRLAGGYGDPRPWQTGDSTVMTALSFLNCQKYPPSLDYLLMTLGPALLALGWMDREAGRVGRWLVVLGRVPLFYYVLHLYLIHEASRAFHWIAHGEPFSSLGDGLPRLFRGQPLPAWYGQSLGVVYAAWIGCVLLLYPACAWYAGVKARSRSRWLSYL